LSSLVCQLFLCSKRDWDVLLLANTVPPRWCFFGSCAFKVWTYFFNHSFYLIMTFLSPWAYLSTEIVIKHGLSYSLSSSAILRRTPMECSRWTLTITVSLQNRNRMTWIIMTEKCRSPPCWKPPSKIGWTLSDPVPWLLTTMSELKLGVLDLLSSMAT